MKKFIFAAVAVLMMGMCASCGSTKSDVNDSDSVVAVDSLAVDTVDVDTITVDSTAFECAPDCTCK